jgi:hypothetical protein
MNQASAGILDHEAAAGASSLRPAAAAPEHHQATAHAAKSARSREQGRLDDLFGDVSIGCGMLHQREDPVGHEPRSTDSGPAASHLRHLDDTAPGVDLNPAPVAGRDDFVRTHLVACIYDDLDSVTAHMRTVP